MIEALNLAPSTVALRLLPAFLKLFAKISGRRGRLQSTFDATILIVVVCSLLSRVIPLLRMHSYEI